MCLWPLRTKDRSLNIFIIFTPHACARGKTIGLYVCRRHHQHENRQISHSRHLSVIDWFVRIAQKGFLELQIVQFQFSMPVVYQPHPLYWHVLMRLRMLKLTGRQVIKQLCMQ